MTTGKREELASSIRQEWRVIWLGDKCKSGSYATEAEAEESRARTVERGWKDARRETHYAMDNEWVMAA